MILAFAPRCLSRPRSSGPVPVCLGPPAAAASPSFAVLDQGRKLSSAAIGDQIDRFLSMPIPRKGQKATYLPDPRSIESA